MSNDFHQKNEKQGSTLNDKSQVEKIAFYCIGIVNAEGRILNTFYSVSAKSYDEKPLRNCIRRDLTFKSQ